MVTVDIFEAEEPARLLVDLNPELHLVIQKSTAYIKSTARGSLPKRCSKRDWENAPATRALSANH